jgi:hypothetical protein
MPLENFLVRNKRRLVERYSNPGAWDQLDMTAQGELTREVAGLPSVHADTDLDAKQFDVLILNLQLVVLRVDARFDELKESVIELAGAMEQKQTIPMVREQLPLIQEVQTTLFWQGVTVPEPVGSGSSSFRTSFCAFAQLRVFALRRINSPLSSVPWIHLGHLQRRQAGFVFLQGG